MNSFVNPVTAVKLPSRSTTFNLKIAMTTRLFRILAGMLLVLGFVGTYWLANLEDARMRNNLLIQARIIAANIYPEDLQKLTGSALDIESAIYRRLKEHLIQLRTANPLCRFIYLTGMRPDGRVYFFVDSESPGSEDYSPPGQIYQEVGETFRGVFTTGREAVEGPVTDRWGNWVSALVPIVDPETAGLLGVLGMDIDARDWKLKLLGHCVPAIFLTVLLGALLSFFYILFRRDEKARQEIAQSESRLEESERAYRSVVMNMLDIFFRVDSKGHIVMLSPSASSILGYDGVDQLIGKKIEVIWADPRRLLGLYQKLLQLGSVRDWEMVARHRDGRELDFSVTVNMLADSAGRPLGYEGIARDISERNRAEKQRLEMEKQIQRAQKMEAMGALAGGVAHDLNNILSGILSYPDMILSQTPQDSSLRRPLEIIRESGMKASVIVNDLLTLARRGVSVSEVVNLNELIVDYLRSPEYIKLLSFHPGLTVSTEFDDRLKHILGSPVHLSKTIMNLVTNAAESMPEGGLITILTANRYVDYPIKLYEQVREGEYVVLSVIDSGIGVSQEDQSRIFEPFFTNKKMGRSGTGLGMAVVWGAVKDQKGYIDIQSAKGKGTSIKLYFPVTGKLPGKRKKDLDFDSIRGSGQKILVVDDISEQREVASGILSRLGYDVTSLCSGEEAVRFLQTETADLLLLDMLMAPGIDGLETYQRILVHTPGQRAIICSGYSETDRLKETLHLGAGGFLKKPYTFEGLANAVREELRREL